MNTATRNRTVDLVRFPSIRAVITTLVIGIAFATLIGRALWLQSFQDSFLQEKGASRYRRVLELSAHRGTIADRRGEPLAMSTPVKSIWAIPGDFKGGPAQKQQLAKLLGLPLATLEAKLSDTERDFVFLRRQVPPEIADQVQALQLEGIHQDREYGRYYPAGEVAAQLIGWTGIDDNGQEGIELAKQDWLVGRAGSREVIKDRRGTIVEDVGHIRLPEPGKDLRLAMDSKIQYLAFRELQTAVDENQAKAGGLVVINVDTGEILALANIPSFNPNNRATWSRERTRNRALTDTFEPGSTMKPFTAAAALEAGLFKPDTLITTGNGSLTIGKATIHDAHAAGTVTVEQAIQKSSNVATAKMALQMTPEYMWSLLSRAGFGTPPKTGFPGEVGGKLRSPKTWKPIEQATMAYGHGLSVNLVQLARAYSIFATEGELKPLSLYQVDSPVYGQPVISKETALAVRKMLEMAVLPGGTAPKAQVAGYRVAGKTGTAHKLERGAYVKKYVSSFVGLAPASHPKLLVAVMIDEPSAGVHYGGQVAAPVFSKVMAEALKIQGIPPDAPLNNLLRPESIEEVREEV